MRFVAILLLCDEVAFLLLFELQVQGFVVFGDDSFDA